MMNSKITKAIINGTILAGIAALGITVYQLGTGSVTEENEDSSMVEMVENTGENADEEETETASSEGASDSGFGQEDTLASAETEDEENPVESEDPAEDASAGAADAASETAGEAEASDTTDGLQKVLSTSADITLDFSEDSLMEWPVNGTTLIDYNMDNTVYFRTLDQYKLSSALAVQAVENAPVVAAVNGQVTGIEQEAETGTTVTMDLGNGYEAIYGQLKDLCVEEGDLVKKGYTIGYISAPTIYYTVEGSNLYFAMEKDGEPIDPILYLP
ncbi:MAG: M23 family metallopeptidase [Clostridiales bacterium]|nr:M23 family metallopeptidase [Clostridiales bacterium]